MIEGMNQKIVEGTKKALEFRSNDAYDTFVEVQLNGKTLDDKYYEVKEGSTIVSLRSDYVSLLRAGEYTVSIVSDGGVAEGKLTVVPVEDKGVKTGDDNNILLYGFASILALIGVASVYGLRRRNEK